MTVTQYSSSVRQMSQSKFESMKNDSGKIPELANQIVMTDAEDSSISCLRTEVVYDMTSSDASKNWGYTSGIRGSTTPITKDLTNYKSLLIYYQCFFVSPTNVGGNANCLILDLERITDNYSIAGNDVSYFSDNTPNVNKFSFQAKYNHSTKKLNFLFGYGTNAELNVDGYYVYKIEGVLKTPAMIYTGDELIAGNGITINNGTIEITPAQQVSLNSTMTGQNDTVVEYYMSSDGNTWYRKWASGWKECGLHVVKTMKPPANGANSGFGVITLPVTFSNKLYQTQITNEWKVAYGNKFFFSAERNSDASTNNAISVAVTACTNSSLSSSMQIACNIYCCGF